MTWILKRNICVHWSHWELGANSCAAPCMGGINLRHMGCISDQLGSNLCHLQPLENKGLFTDNPVTGCCLEEEKYQRKWWVIFVFVSFAHSGPYATDSCTCSDRITKGFWSKTQKTLRIFVVVNNQNNLFSLFLPSTPLVSSASLLTLCCSGPAAMFPSEEINCSSIKSSTRLWDR